MEKVGDDNRENMKTEQICRTCLLHDGHFFDITHTFDRITLAQMIQDITNLQINSLDGYTQSVCFKCVKEVRRAHKFRRKCLESSHNLVKLNINEQLSPTKPLEELQVLSYCKVELPELEDIKEELNENCNLADFLKTEYDDDDESFNQNALVSDCDNNDESRDMNICDTNKKIKKSPKIIFDCPLCHGLFSNDNSFNKHIYELHPDRIKDESFTKKFVPLGFIIKKKTEFRFKYLYKCALNDFTGNSLIEFKNHMRVHTGEKPVTCIDCGFRTRDIPQLKNHRIQRHTEEKKFCCPDCNYSCKTQKALKYHSVLHTSEKNYECKLCSMTFKRPSDLSVHKKVKHEMRKSHVCSICQKAFFHSKVLKNHMAVHTGERPHICHFCGFAFTQRNNLRTHVSLMHEPAKVMFKCELCNYSAKQKVQLSAHMKTHTGEKNFQCPHCPFRTSKNSTLKYHIMRHFGETRFSCDLCDYKCMTPFELKIHRRTHTGERPFPCTVCTYSGKSQEALKIHMQTHNTDLKFVCPNCPYRTNVQVALRRHLRKTCVIKKRGRPPLKPPVLPELNDKIKEDSGKPFIVI